MEGKSLSNSLKDHSIVSIRTSSNNNDKSSSSNKKLKDPWTYNSQSHGEDYGDGFSWPPRSYTCSFCKREFRSAQALGGHMNVHRRDRAKLRQSPPRDGQFHVLNLNLNPNSNPNPSFSSPFSCTMPPLISPPSSALPSPSFSSPCQIRKWAIDGELLDPLSPKASDLSKIRTRKSLLDAKEYDGFAQQGGCNFLKKAEFMKLDLGIGLLSDSKEDLDLELRLGYS